MSKKGEVSGRERSDGSRAERSLGWLSNEGSCSLGSAGRLLVNDRLSADGSCVGDAASGFCCSEAELSREIARDPPKPRRRPRSDIVDVK